MIAASELAEMENLLLAIIMNLGHLSIIFIGLLPFIWTVVHIKRKKLTLIGKSTSE